jgi:hypothetical protein
MDDHMFVCVLKTIYVAIWLDLLCGFVSQW